MRTKAAQLTSPSMKSNLPIALIKRLVYVWLATTALGTTTACAMLRHVTTTEDNNKAGSIRYEIEHSIDGDSIDFQLLNCPCVIKLHSPLVITNSIAIYGPGPAILALDGESTASVIYIEALNFRISDLTIQNENNIAQDGGAGILNGDEASFANVRFINNSAGGLTVWRGHVTVSKSSFVSNGTPYEWTYAILQHACDGCSLVVTESSFIGNTGLSCPGIYAAAPIVISNDTFAGNTALDYSADYRAQGGAVCITSTASGGIFSSSFTDNWSTYEGGALAIESGGTVVVANSVFAHNRAEVGPNIFGAIVSMGNNLVSNRSGSAGYQKSTCNPLLFDLHPPDLPEQDPNLSPLHMSAESGLPIVTPNPLSPLIDAISIGGRACDGFNVPKIDARGVSRPYGKAADIGAIEFIPNDDRLFCDALEVTTCKLLK
jgi:hypothetical protein